LRTSLPKEKASFYFTEEDSRTRASSLAKGSCDQAALSAKLATEKHAGLKMEKLVKDFPAKPTGLKVEKMEKAFPAKPAGLKIQNSVSAKSSDSESVSDLRGRGRVLAPLCCLLYHASHTSVIASSCAASGRRWRRCMRK
jgi:hypothetical protein